MKHYILVFYNIILYSYKYKYKYGKIRKYRGLNTLHMYKEYLDD
jgi:hypothetical protein